MVREADTRPYTLGDGWQTGEASAAPPSADTSTNSAAQEGRTRTLTLSEILASDFR
jgi:hypothetical protein